MNKLFTILFLIGSFLTYSQNTKTIHINYENPIIDEYLADPFIFYENGTYYLFATGYTKDDKGIPIYKSDDLKDWDYVKGAVKRGDSTSWNYKHFWAPEVHKFDDTYYLYYTASPKISPKNSGNKVGVATAKHITGPYTDHGPVIPHGSIDGHPFLDDDHQLYFYFTVEQLNATGLPKGKIYAYRMKDPLTIVGDPIPLITKHGWQEGPYILKKDDEYWMTYSTGAWKNETYHVKLAKAKSPLGPYKLIDETLLKTNDVVKGPGHNALFTDERGDLWIIYHGWDKNFKARYPRIDPLYWKDGVLKCDGPTGNK